MLLHLKMRKKQGVERKKEKLWKAFVGLINVPRPETRNPWNCGKSKIYQESLEGQKWNWKMEIYIWSCLWILLQFAKQTYVVCLGGTLLIKFETQMPRNPRFVFLIRLCKNFWASHISSEFPFICSFPIYFPVESAKNCEPPISLQVFISVFISIRFSFEFKNNYIHYFHLCLFICI